MLSRLTLLWSCLALLCVACSLESSPRVKAKSAHERSDGGAWRPRGAGGNGQRVNSERSETEDVVDASKSEAQAQGDAAASAPAKATSPANPLDSGTTKPSTPADASQDPSAPGPSAPTAGDGAQPSTPAAGAGGMAGDLATSAAGSAGAADSGAKSARQSLIDAAIEALGGGSSDGGEYPWRNGGRDGDGLSAEFVKSVLISLVASGTCYRDRRRCVQTCFVIANDCKPCSKDPECADALRSACGQLGTCSSP